MLYEIDEYLLDKVQDFCDEFTKITGRTKFFMEKWVLVTEIVFVLLFCLLVENLITISFGGILVGMTVAQIILLEKSEESFLETGKLYLPVLNSARLHNRIFALLVVFATVTSCMLVLAVLPITFFIDSYFSIITAYSVCSFVETYISSCTPLRPRKSKLRIWSERFVGSLKANIPKVPLGIPTNI